jgi:hypothetical protein
MAAGVPLVVARKMQQGPLLLGRLVASVDAAVAAAAEGANFILLQVCALRLVLYCPVLSTLSCNMISEGVSWWLMHKP